MRSVFFQHIFTPHSPETSHVPFNDLKPKAWFRCFRSLSFLAISLGPFTFIFTALFHYFSSTLPMYIAIPNTLR